MPRQARSYARCLLLSANFGECPECELDLDGVLRSSSNTISWKFATSSNA
jgi:hypothetical protein